MKCVSAEKLAYYDKKLKEFVFGKYVSKEAGKGLSTNDFTDDWKKKIEDLAYEEIVITAFSNSKNMVEIGTTVTEVSISWTINKTPKSLKLDGADVEVTETSKVFVGQSITADKTYSLVATDERGASSAKTTKISFLNGVYWGVGAASATLDNAFILGLTKGLQSSKAKTFTVTAGAGEHIYYALPARYGTPGFNVGGFDGGFGKAGTVEFTNASGHTEQYDVWKSTNASLGGTTVKVS